MITNAILLDLPLPIYTERLIIRPAMPGDGKEIFKAIDESRREFEPWLSWVYNVKTWQDSEVTIREFYADFILRKSFHFVIIYNSNIIGMCSLHTDKDLITSGIGYWLRTSATGKGFMQEAVAAITKYGFEIIKLKKISITCNDLNTRSSNVAEKLGFTLETRALDRIEGHLNNELFMSRKYVKFII